MTATTGISSRHQRQLDQELVRSLTRACEAAKAEVEGFAWVTHAAQWDNFPASLRLVWVFETKADVEQALEKGYGERLYALSTEALSESGIQVQKITAHVSFDSEEECQRVDHGNWQLRLDRLHSTKH
jgi:hypothetical protein